MLFWLLHSAYELPDLECPALVPQLLEGVLWKVLLNLLPVPPGFRNELEQQPLVRPAPDEERAGAPLQNEPLVVTLSGCPVPELLRDLPPRLLHVAFGVSVDNFRKALSFRNGPLAVSYHQFIIH